MRKMIFLLLLTIVGFSYCKAQNPHTSKPSSSSMLKGKGTLSFTLNGQLHKSDSTQTKCWTTAQIPLAMCWAKGTDMLISWQIQTVPGSKGTYKIDKDSKGAVNFTIGTKTYWVRKTDGSNYLNIIITGVKDLYSVKLLSGTFDGVLEDKDGNKVQVTGGKFVTEGI